MTKFGIYKETADIPFETHLVQLDQKIKGGLLELRNFVNSMGENVIEEVRPHRISYSKGVVFRVFLDIQPTKNELIISIRKNRKEPPKIYNSTCNDQEMSKVKEDILDAYKNIL